MDSLLRHWGELAADFRQYYGIDLPPSLDELEDEEGLRLGELWAHLPRESRTVTRLSPDAQWDDDTWLLWRIEYVMASILWAETCDRRHPTPRPRPMATPGEAARALRRRDDALASKGEIMGAFGMSEG